MRHKMSLKVASKLTTAPAPSATSAVKGNGEEVSGMGECGWDRRRLWAALRSSARQYWSDRKSRKDTMPDYMGQMDLDWDLQ